MVSPGGSFSETFHSLRRSAPGFHGNGPLGRKKLIVSMLCLVSLSLLYFIVCGYILCVFLPK